MKDIIAVAANRGLHQTFLVLCARRLLVVLIAVIAVMTMITTTMTTLTKAMVTLGCRIHWM